jgi:hypothetical protein
MVLVRSRSWCAMLVEWCLDPGVTDGTLLPRKPALLTGALAFCLCQGCKTVIAAGTVMDIRAQWLAEPPRGSTSSDNDNNMTVG